ncbi:hypothetical protein X534_gp11 [Ralstonia phage RSB3]|uniref:DUF1508 domain-containing protein n=1 Tax=Ralstonia phage RSB3 TaxID=1402875 RepID=U3TFL4_9CAUD|nr:hypothetical protein X534_gp11 [Ralstonia phage RSB3]BAN92322.1 hypothetical protein [Ralstonia phage RSB3]
MYGIQAINNINAAHAERNTQQDRYQAQWKGEGWTVFDSHTNGWGASYATAKDCQQACDALNA